MFRIQKKKKPTQQNRGADPGELQPAQIPSRHIPASPRSCSVSKLRLLGTRLGAPWALFHNNPQPHDAASSFAPGVCHAHPHQVTATGQSPLHQRPALTACKRHRQDASWRLLSKMLPTRSLHTLHLRAALCQPHRCARGTCPRGCPSLAGYKNRTRGIIATVAPTEGGVLLRAPSHGTANEAPALCQQPHAARGCEHRRCPRNLQSGMGGTSPSSTLPESSGQETRNPPRCAAHG